MSTETIYQTFASKLLSFILSKVDDRATAEDLLQEAFVKIHQNVDKLKDDQKLTSWVYQITRNVINDYFRKSKGEFIYAEVEVQDEIESDELGTCMLCLIDSLPVEYKRPLYLSDIKGMAQQEIADKLKIGYSATKSRIQRARKMIAEKLKECNVEDVYFGSENCGKAV